MRRITIVTVLLLAVGIIGTSCATGGGGSAWVRHDGSTAEEGKLAKDRLDCFPTVSPGGPMSMGVVESEDCMRGRGWRKR